MVCINSFPFNSIEIDRVEKWNVMQHMKTLNNRKNVMVDWISCLCYLIKHSNRVKEKRIKTKIISFSYLHTTLYTHNVCYYDIRSLSQRNNSSFLTIIKIIMKCNNHLNVHCSELKYQLFLIISARCTQHTTSHCLACLKNWISSKFVMFLFWFENLIFGFCFFHSSHRVSNGMRQSDYFESLYYSWFLITEIIVGVSSCLLLLYGT